MIDARSSISMGRNQRDEGVERFHMEQDQDVRKDNASGNNDSRSMVKRSASNVRRQLLEASRRDTGKSKSLSGEYFQKILRPGFVLNHLDKQSLLVVGRTYVFLMTFVFLAVITPVNRWFGYSAYLLNLGTIWDPPGGYSVCGGVFISLMQFSFVVLSFTFFVVSSALIWRIDGYMTVEDVMLDLNAGGQCLDGSTYCMEVAILDGRYMNVKTVAVTIFAIVICLAVEKYITSRQPYFRLTWLFGMVSALNFLTTSAHVPFFSPWDQGRSTVICFGFICAHKALLCVVFAPITSSCKLIRSFSSSLKKFTKTANDMFSVAEALRPSDPDFRDKMGKFPHLYEKILHSGSTLLYDHKVSRYELSYSRFDSYDLYELDNRVKSVGNNLYSFEFFYQELHDKAQASIERAHQNQFHPNDEKDLDPAQTPRPRMTRGRSHTFEYPNAFAAGSKWVKRKTTKTYQHAGTFEQFQRDEYLANEQVLHALDTQVVDKIYKDIIQYYEPLISVCLKGIEASAAWMAEANKYRTICLFSKHYRLKRREGQYENGARIQRAMDSINDTYKVLGHDTEWIRTHVMDIDLDSGVKSYILDQYLYYGFLTREFVRHVRNVLKWCVYLDKTRPEPKFAIFKRSRKRANRYYATEESENIVEDLGDLPDLATRFVPMNTVQARNPNATPPRNLFHVFAYKAITLKSRIWTEQTQAAVKFSFMCVIPLTPFFARPSLRFMNEHRAIWSAIIMMMTVSSRPSESVFGLICRSLATLFGCILGTVCWYISTGSGNGNPYGLCATLAVIMVFISFHRHYNTIGGAVMSIVFGITTVMVTVVNYSDRKNPSPAAIQQSAVMIAVERFIAAYIGVFLGFLATVFPHATTTKTSVRNAMAKILRSLGDIQSNLINFAFQRYDDPHVHRDLYQDVIVRKIRGVFSESRTTYDQMLMLRYEPPLTGKWPKHHYDLLLALQEEIAHMFPLIYALMNNIENHERIPELLTYMGWLHPRLLSSVYSVLFMASSAIKTGDPLPTITPGHTCEAYQDFIASLFRDTSLGADVFEYEKRLYDTHDGRLILTSKVLAELFLQRIDGVMMIIKGLVGEYYGTDSRVWSHELA